MSKKKKDNFNKAVYDMFGVGKDSPEAEGTEEAFVPDQELFYEDEALPVEEDVHAPLPVTYIAPGTTVEGTLKAAGDVEITGEFKGDITSDGSVTLHTSVIGNVTAVDLIVLGCTLTGDATISGQLVLDADSGVNGDISASDVECAGDINGNLTVKGGILLHPTARIQGDVSTGTMSIERGAALHGKIEMRGL